MSHFTTTVWECTESTIPLWKRRVRRKQVPVFELMLSLYVRVFWLIITNRIHTVPLDRWMDSTGNFDIKRVRKYWFVKLPCIETTEEVETEREIEIEYTVTWHEAEPEVGWGEPHYDVEIESATYTDTGEPYKGDLDVERDDIEQYVYDNPEDV